MCVVTPREHVRAVTCILDRFSVQDSSMLMLVKPSTYASVAGEVMPYLSGKGRIRQVISCHRVGEIIFYRYSSAWGLTIYSMKFHWNQNIIAMELLQFPRYNLLSFQNFKLPTQCLSATTSLLGIATKRALRAR